MKKKNLIILICAIVLLFIAGNSNAQIPGIINFQAKITDNAGDPLNGVNSFNFAIMNISSQTLWSANSIQINVVDGLYSVKLGDPSQGMTPIPSSVFDDNDETFLRIWVNGEQLTDQPILPVGYAHKSEYSDQSENSEKVNNLNPDYYLGIESINNQLGDGNRNVTIAGSTGINVSTSNNTITISGSGIQTINGGDGIQVTNPNGPTTTISSTLGTSISNSELENNSVTSTKILDGTITGNDIASNTISISKISTDIVSSLDGVSNDGGNIDFIAGNNITITPNNSQNTITISSSGGGGNGTVTQVNTGTGLTGGPITTTGTISIANGGVGSTQLSTSAVTNSKIADNAVTSSKISDGTISNSDLGSNCVTSNKIQNGTITTDDINFDVVSNPCSDVFQVTNQVLATSLFIGSSSQSVNTGDIEAADDIFAGDDIRAYDGKAVIGSSSGNTGGVWLDGSSGNDLAALSAISGATNNGALFLYENGSSNSRVHLYAKSSNGAGYLSLKDGSGGSSIWLDGETGNIYKDVCYFYMDHPKNPNKLIVYACIEGPEAATYTRGTVKLTNGEAWVSFEEHFSIVINPETMTVQLTPLSAESEGLAVIEKSSDGFKVKELRGGKGSYKFDYFVQGVRKGYEDYEVIRDKEITEEPTLETQ